MLVVTAFSNVTLVRRHYVTQGPSSLETVIDMRQFEPRFRVVLCLLHERRTPGHRALGHRQ